MPSHRALPFGDGRLPETEAEVAALERLEAEQEAAGEPERPRCTADEDECDGYWHSCWTCGGEGYVESDDRQDDDDQGDLCPDCMGRGGLLCPYPIADDPDWSPDA